MTSKERMVLFVALFAVGAAMAASPAKAPTYILNGYNFSGIHGVNAAEMEAKLKHHEGARITQADIAVDTAIVTKEIEARHLEGKLFTTLAESHGRVWIIFDLLNPDAGKPMLHLDSQNFEGASRVSASVLAAAIGLKKGDQLSKKKLVAARQAIMAIYAKSLPGKKITLKCRLQVRRGGDKTIVTWIIGEPK